MEECHFIHCSLHHSLGYKQGLWTNKQNTGPIHEIGKGTFPKLDASEVKLTSNQTSYERDNRHIILIGFSCCCSFPSNLFLGMSPIKEKEELDITEFDIRYIACHVRMLTS